MSFVEYSDHYALPEPPSVIPSAEPKTALLISSGDSRLSANRAGWDAQLRMESALGKAFARLGWSLVRGHALDESKGHGFIDSQRMGMDVFRGLAPEAPVVVAEAVWQYSSHVLAGLRHHRGPILTVANWSGEWPGLVGLLNLNASLTKMGCAVLDGLERRLLGRLVDAVLGAVGREPARSRHDLSHVGLFDRSRTSPRLPSGGRSRISWPRQSDLGRLRRGLHGDVQRSHRRRDT